MATFQMLTMMVVALLVLLSQDGLGNPLVDGGVSSLTEEGTAFSDIQTRVSGGLIAKKGQFPYVVFIERKLTANKYGPRAECTGNIISPSWILSAAHCLGNKTLYNTLNPYNDGRFNNHVSKLFATPNDVYYGDDIVAIISAKRSIDKHVPFPNAFTYKSAEDVKGKVNVDMVLLRVKVPFKDQPMAVLSGPLPYGEKAQCQVAGYAGWAGILKYLESPATRFSDRYEPTDVWSSTMLDRMEDGDSGGPLVCRSGKDIALVGTLSRQVERSGQKYIVWTKVGQTVGEWIRSVTGGTNKFQTLQRAG